MDSNLTMTTLRTPTWINGQPCLSQNGASSNGARERGVEALGDYSEFKNISFLNRSELV